jgi:hypothetical protein
VYVTGYTQSANYPTTTGAFQTTNGGGTDVFVTKLNSTGSALIYSTYIGGSSNDYGNSLVIDGSENAYVTGYTESTDYDITGGAFQTIFGGLLWDVFVTKLNSTGTGLIYSTYIGGSGIDCGYDIAIDGSENVYMTGYTKSANYPTTAGAFQTAHGDGGTYPDVFVTKLNNTGTGLVYSTYLGGSGDDQGRSITLDGGGNAYVGGSTFSTDYDTTMGAFQTTHGGGLIEVFVTKLDLSGTISVNAIPQGTKRFTLYPNPNNGNFIINTSKRFSVFELTDITGRLIEVYEAKESEVKVNTNIPAGVYFIREKESGTVQKIIIQ